jgi:phosphoribosylformimino-5-aminoimidazole carboxamide ribonucleotide (ProFAR) isomerase
MKRKTQAIVMFTNHDKTVGNTLELFEQCKDLPLENWGFKTSGQPVEKLREFAKAIKSAGKKLFVEVITFTQQEYEMVAEFCKNSEVDVLLGTIYDKTLQDKLKKCHTQYYPFAGKTVGYRGEIIKSMEEILADAKEIADMKADGIAVPAYMHKEIDGDDIVKALCDKFPEMPILVAGRVKTYERIDRLFEIGVANYTIGGALFSGEFAKGKGFRENVGVLAKYMNNHG